MAQIVQDVEGPIALRSVNIIHGLSGRPAQPKEGIIPALRSPWSVEIRGAIHNLRYTNRPTVRCAIRLDTGLSQELAQQMREVTCQIAALTNELESLVPPRPVYQG